MYASSCHGFDTAINIFSKYSSIMFKISVHFITKPTDIFETPFFILQQTFYMNSMWMNFVEIAELYPKIYQ